MSWSAKCTWNELTPGSVPWGVRERREVVAERRGLLGEPVTGELHSVAGVASETNDDPVELLDLLGHEERLLLFALLLLAPARWSEPHLSMFRPPILRAK
jgi:hypothetical protein